jgi:hypothetical protein
MGQRVTDTEEGVTVSPRERSEHQTELTLLLAWRVPNPMLGWFHLPYGGGIQPPCWWRINLRGRRVEFSTYMWKGFLTSMRGISSPCGRNTLMRERIRILHLEGFPPMGERVPNLHAGGGFQPTLFT